MSKSDAKPAKRDEREFLVIDGHEVAVSSPRKVLFPDAGYTKLDLVHYYLSVAEGALRGAGGRPNVMVRYPNGIAGDFFYQKRAPASRPPWIEVVSLRFPSGRSNSLMSSTANVLVLFASAASTRFATGGTRRSRPPRHVAATGTPGEQQILQLKGRSAVGF